MGVENRGYVPEEDGIMTKLAKKFKNTILGGLIVASLELGNPNQAEAQTPEEYSEQLKKNADDAQAELGKMLAEDREAIKKALDEYEHKVKEYYKLRTDLSAEEAEEQIRNMVDYAAETYRGRPKNWVEAVAPMYNKAIDQQIAQQKAKSGPKINPVLKAGHKSSKK